MFESVPVHDESRLMPAVHPRLCNTPASTRWAGPDLGQHTEEVLRDWLDVDAAIVAQWRKKQLI